MRYLIKFSYDGTNYCGFQRQKDLKTIQEELENALKKINNNITTPLVATGRTDKLVHALCQYAHADISVNITPHKLRATCATNLYKKTGDIYLVADQLGHANIATTKIYTEIDVDAKRKAINILDNLIWQL